MINTILVTGGAGYIGSHAVLALQQQGNEVIILDNLVNGHRYIAESVLGAKLIVGDIGDRQLLDQIFREHQVTAVMHFAAYAYVGESVNEPAKYYRNNLMGTLVLLEAMLAAGVKKLVFSSTCATYGVPSQIPITETHPQAPINPYGASKLAVERMLLDFDIAYGLKSVIFRYFNAAGAEPSGLLGEDHQPETHLIPLVLYTALGLRPSISIFGTDYQTDDGTCVRDYIHVSDLIQAHLQGLDYLLADRGSNIFNLGNGDGFSVRQVIEVARKVTGRNIVALECPRRPGDPGILVGSGQKATQILGWQPQYSDLEQIISHAWHWHLQRHAKKVAV
ncbi:MAG: UDP-glucose 4-epimerase GalE [Cyanobacteria bacterium P01_C01_bin.72]